MYVLCMEKRTNIQIEHETLEDIKKEKEGRETYDDVITRLLRDKKWQETEKMEMYLGEFIDRLAILLHKSQKIGPESYPEFIRYVQYLLLKVPEGKFDVLIRSFRKIYYINGESANMGISQYKIQPSDKIEWKFEESTL